MVSSLVSHFPLSDLVKGGSGGGVHREHVSSHSERRSRQDAGLVGVIPGHRFQRQGHIVAGGGAALHELKVVLLRNKRRRRWMMDEPTENTTMTSPCYCWQTSQAKLKYLQLIGDFCFC